MINFECHIGQCVLNNEHYEATILTFEIEGGICEPSDLATMNLPNVAGELGLIISGRGPVWLYAALAHHYHVTAWVGTFDPRVGGRCSGQHSQPQRPACRVCRRPPKTSAPSIKGRNHKGGRPSEYGPSQTTLRCPRTIAPLARNIIKALHQGNWETAIELIQDKYEETN